jgi:hypothetical protein
MIENSGIPCVGIRRRGRGSRFDRGVVALCLTAALLAGCHNEASTGKAPAKTDGSTAQADSAQKAASEAKPVELKATELPPTITFEKPVLDLGEIGTDSKRTGGFKFTNTGKSPLKILQVHSCCGVATKGVEAGDEFAPGESGVLEFEYLVGSTPSAAMTKELRIRTNDPEHTIVSLTIKAAIVRRVECTPRALRLFLKRENAGCGDVTIRSLDGRPFSITSIKSTANAVPIDYDPNAQATEFVLNPRPDMEKLPHNVRGVISFDLTHPECSNVRVLFDVLPEFTVNPAHLMLFNVRAGQPIQRELIVLSNYQDEFEIESVSSQKGFVKLLDKKKLGNRYQLEVEITAPARQGEDTIVADVIEIKVKDGEPVSIPLRGFYGEDR